MLDSYRQSYILYPWYHNYIYLGCHYYSRIDGARNCGTLQLHHDKSERFPTTVNLIKADVELRVTRCVYFGNTKV